VTAPPGWVTAPGVGRAGGRGVAPGGGYRGQGVDVPAWGGTGVGEPNSGMGVGAEARIEGLRGALLRVRYGLRCLAERERFGRLPPGAVVRRRELHAEAEALTGALRQALRSRRHPDAAALA